MYNGVLLNHKKEWRFDTCYDINELETLSAAAAETLC